MFVLLPRRAGCASLTRATGPLWEHLDLGFRLRYGRSVKEATMPKRRPYGPLVQAVCEVCGGPYMVSQYAVSRRHTCGVDACHSEWCSRLYRHPQRDEAVLLMRAGAHPADVTVQFSLAAGLAHQWAHKAGIAFPKRTGVGQKGRSRHTHEYIARRSAKQQGPGHPSWRGGRLSSDGYVLIWRPEHHRAGSKGYVAEHILRAEEAFGRPVLATEVVHHINAIRDDNRPENLWVCSGWQHARAHRSAGRLLKELYAQGVIRFDRDAGVYVCL